MANAGRILIIPKGEYNASTTYTMLDLVSYNGASWLAKKTAVGITPSDANSEFWQKLIEVSGKQDVITGGASSITKNNLTASRALVSNANGKVAVSAITETELGYLDGVTGNVQSQLNGKSASGHTHKYAGSSSEGGSATSALVCTGNSATATKATQDSKGQQIDSTYVKDVVANDNVITVTKGNGTSKNITIGVGDEATVRYVNDESDENYGWVQYKDVDGTWVNWNRLYFGNNHIIQDGIYNDDEFPYNTDSVNKVIVTNTSDGVKFYPSTLQSPNIATFGKFDFSKYSKVKMNILSYKHGYTTSSEGVKCLVGIIDVIPSTFGNIPDRALIKLIINNTGNVELDVSNINTEAFFFIKVVSNDVNNQGFIEFRDLWIE